jgi:hypothetical protein
MLDQPHDLVSLGRVWEFPHDQAAILIAEIERQFRNSQVPIFGRRPGKVDRELIAFPIDYEIDWLGQRSLRGADYCEPRACRRVDLSAPWRKEYDRDVFEDLVIPRAHWNQIARKLSLSEAIASDDMAPPVIESAKEYDAATAAGWAAELEKPFRLRSLFSCFEIAEHLTRKSVAEPDFGKRDRVLLDLDNWIKRGEFDLSCDSDVVLRIGERPYFRPFRAADIATTPGEMAGLAAHNLRCVYLRKSACRRYIEANLELENARRILVLWFPETVPSAPRPAAAEKPDSVESERATNALLVDAVTGALRTVGTPGKTVQWQRFCDHVRRECKATAQTRGYGDRSIQRLVKRIEAGRDNPDKCAMS